MKAGAGPRAALHSSSSLDFCFSLLRSLFPRSHWRPHGRRPQGVRKKVDADFCAGLFWAAWQKERRGEAGRRGTAGSRALAPWCRPTPDATPPSLPSLSLAATPARIPSRSRFSARFTTPRLIQRAKQREAESARPTASAKSVRARHSFSLSPGAPPSLPPSLLQPPLLHAARVLGL